MRASRGKDQSSLCDEPTLPDPDGGELREWDHGARSIAVTELSAFVDHDPALGDFKRAIREVTAPIRVSPVIVAGQLRRIVEELVAIMFVMDPIRPACAFEFGLRE